MKSNYELAREILFNNDDTQARKVPVREAWRMALEHLAESREDVLKHQATIHDQEAVLKKLAWWITEHLGSCPVCGAEFFQGTVDDHKPDCYLTRFMWCRPESYKPGQKP